MLPQWRHRTADSQKDPNHGQVRQGLQQAADLLLGPHTPLSTHAINRTTWRMANLQEVLRRQGRSLCKAVIRTILKEAGYKWRSARAVLTGTNPEHRTRVDGIKKILAELGQDDAFFSIDEYGPLAEKKKGRVKRVAPGQEYVI